MVKNIFFIIFLLSLSCARINQESRDYYKSEKKMRHGIVPLEAPQNAQTQQEKLNEESVQRGKALYQKNCQSCHGVNGEGAVPGQMKAANLKKLALEVKDFKFFISVSQWQGDMPGWKSPMSETEREDLTQYIKSFAREH